MKPKKHRYSLAVLNDIAIVKKHLDDEPFNYKSSGDLLNKVTSSNRKSLTKAFREIYGYGIKAYHVKQRLEKSKTCLKEGMTIKLAADACLYKSQNAYAAAFKKEFGMTPSEWVNSISKEISKKLSKRKGNGP